jgi:hypothetical protein
MAEQQSSSPIAGHSQDFFQLMFDAADLYASVWQPLFKSVGRWNLEVAGLGIRHSQASLRLARDLARVTNPAEWTSATVRYWDQISTHYAESTGRLAATVKDTVDAHVAPEIVPLPVRARDNEHDVLVLPTGDGGERKVA